jgi:hypothetical protein
MATKQDMIGPRRKFVMLRINATMSYEQAAQRSE